MSVTVTSVCVCVCVQQWKIEIFPLTDTNLAQPSFHRVTWTEEAPV